MEQEILKNQRGGRLRLGRRNGSGYILPRRGSGRLRRLPEYGLLRARFHPKGEAATLRAYLRQRERQLDSATSHIQHMQKALMQMNLQRHQVVPDVTGVAGMKIIGAIVAGERAARRWPLCAIHAGTPQLRRFSKP
jgi:hypothetical protein